jgi:hypothetical protein
LALVRSRVYSAVLAIDAFGILSKARSVVLLLSETALPLAIPDQAPVRDG